MDTRVDEWRNEVVMDGNMGMTGQLINIVYLGLHVIVKSQAGRTYDI